MPSKILEINNVCAKFAGSRERCYTERMNGDGRIETAAASVLLN